MTSKMNGRLIVYVSAETKAGLVDLAWDLRKKEPGIKVTYDLVISRLLAGQAARASSSGNVEAGHAAPKVEGL